MIKSAEFSPCRKYRYSLWRIWDENLPYAMFIGLNPSTADEENDDPTVRRCIRYAQYWGYGALCMTNIFAYRATLPQDMKNQEHPVGDENNSFLCEMAEGAGVVIAAWGNHGSFMGRSLEVLNLIGRENISFLKMNSCGEPSHPLYLKKDLKPTKWS